MAQLCTKTRTKTTIGLAWLQKLLCYLYHPPSCWLVTYKIKGLFFGVDKVGSRGCIPSTARMMFNSLGSREGMLNYLVLFLALEIDSDSS